MTMNKDIQVNKRIEIKSLPRIKSENSIENHRETRPLKPKMSIRNENIERKTEEKGNSEREEIKIIQKNSEKQTKLQSTNSVHSKLKQSINKKKRASPFTSSNKKRIFLAKELFENTEQVEKPKNRIRKESSLADLHNFNVIINLKEEHRSTPQEYFDYP